MSILSKYLGLGTEANALINDAAERVGTTAEFFEKVAEKLPNLIETAENESDRIPVLLDTAITVSAPWLSAAADVVGDAIPPVKAILSLTKFLTKEPHPNALGLLAVSVAYQAALADAAKVISNDKSLTDRLVRPDALKLRTAVFGNPEELDSFAGFRLATALSHPLVVRADEALHIIAQAAGYPEDIERVLLESVHTRFVEKFRLTIADGRLKEKFDPVFRLMELSGSEVSTYAFLRRHLEYQLWRFNGAPALGKGGALSIKSALSTIFTPLDCGLLTWGEILRGNKAASPQEQRRSAFDEDFGGRQSLLDTVISLISRPDFTDVIVVQGTAGAGKSAFTLQLCGALHDLALRPIRVRMRDLSFDPRMSLLEDIAQALTLNCTDDEFESGREQILQTDIDLSNILTERIPFHGMSMSPYVFIFDGWDEISISASEGFALRIQNTLRAIRREFIDRRAPVPRVRVILTGRPSHEVNEAGFLLKETPILTIRPFTRAQLVSFVDRLVIYRKNEVSLTPLLSVAEERIGNLLNQFHEYQDDERSNEKNILGLPLLALLAIWLVLNDENAPEDIALKRTSLYRRLVDLTTRYGGAAEPIGPAMPRLIGNELRDLLQRTAAAMTMRGTEHISYDELVLRLEAGGVTNPNTIIGQAVADNQLTKLMLSFFFNAGQKDQGCEFIHKSFREYLFAEAVVEAIKRNAVLDGADLARPHYWRDFDDGDPCQALAEELGMLLGPQWLKSEVWTHLSWLISWEINRSVEPQAEQRLEEESQIIPLSAWERARNRLVDLWDWWGDGVHLRQQPYRELGALKFKPPYAVRLAEKIVPTDLPRNVLPQPLRLITLDAHLGDALFRLNCLLHFEINKATGWLDGELTGPEQAYVIWKDAVRGNEYGRRYQTQLVKGDRSWLAFAPSSPDGTNQYFEYYIARINAAGWYPGERFPFDIDFSGLDLFDAPLTGTVFSNINFSCACLDGANTRASIFYSCNFYSTYAPGTRWYRSQFYGDIRNFHFSDAYFADADFDDATCYVQDDADEPNLYFPNGMHVVIKKY
jgi:hypothetical protein